MQEKKHPNIKETIYFEELDNGLHVYFINKPGFNKTYATFTTKYGSIDNEFSPIGQAAMKHVPDGIAHFLEHKMFEKKDYDVFEKFSMHSGSANAFTSFTRTSYLFSCTSDLDENLTTLLDYVQDPYFTPETVEKEKGIIAQEIRMYDDNPDFKAYFGIINNLYAEHPVKIDIAGTVESIQDITADLLYECYHTFYHPSNMIMFVIGEMDVAHTLNLIKENQAAKDYVKQEPIPRSYPKEGAAVAVKERTEEMEIGTAKVFVGIKDPVVGRSGKELLRADITAEIIFDLMFGGSSDYYESMLNKGLINDSFSYETTFEPSFGFSIVGGDTKYPDKLAASLVETLQGAGSIDFNESEFERIKKKKMGRFLSALNSVEFIANQFTQYMFNDVDLFSILDVINEITIDELQDMAKSYFIPERMSTYKLVPKKA
ncbi:MAG: insulinase family protein [Turicibacter sp.]|nr:insulinase family protein [Turicibacter sp.]